MSVLVPPRQLVYPAQRTGLSAALWEKCILAVPFWRGVPWDVSGRDVPVNLVGSPPVVPTDIGYALDLDGSSQGVWADLPAIGGFKSDRVAVTVVIKRVATHDNQVITELSDNFNDTERTFLFWTISTSEVVVAIHDIFNRYANPSFYSPPIGSWSVVTNTYEHSPFGGNEMVVQYFQDGNQQSPISQNLNISPNTSGPFANDVLNIGARDKGGSLYFGGQIAAVIVHDRMLSDAEIALLGRDPFIMFRSDAPEIAALSGAAGGGSVTDTAAITSAAGAILSATDTGLASDTATITAALASALQAVDDGTASDTAAVTSAQASILAGADTGTASDNAAIVTAQVMPLTATGAGIATDTAAIITATATPLTAADSTDSTTVITDTAQITSIIASIRQAQDAGTASDTASVTAGAASILSATDTGTADDTALVAGTTVTILTSAETAKALDQAILVNAQGQPLAALDAGVTGDAAQITSIVATVLTASDNTGDVEALFGNTSIVPVLKGTANLQAKLKGKTTLH